MIGDVDEQTIDLGSVELHVRQRGSGPAVVFGHSLGFDGEMWDAQAAALAGRYRTIAIDFRGHGRSRSTGPFTLDDLADDVARVLDTLAVERASYCGLSQGGMVGMRLALRHPGRVAGLVLANTSAEAEAPARRQMFEAYNEHSRGRSGDPEAAAMMMAMMFSREFLVSRPELATRFRDKLLAARGDDARYFAARAVLGRTSILDAIPTIAVPTVVIGSTGDTAVPVVHARAIAAAIPGATLRIVDGGHMSAVERSDEFTNALLDVLAKVTPLDHDDRSLDSAPGALSGRREAAGDHPT